MRFFLVIVSGIGKNSERAAVHPDEILQQMWYESDNGVGPAGDNPGCRPESLCLGEAPIHWTMIQCGAVAQASRSNNCRSGVSPPKFLVGLDSGYIFSLL